MKPNLTLIKSHSAVNKKNTYEERIYKEENTGVYFFLRTEKQNDYGCYHFVDEDYLPDVDELLEYIDEDLMERVLKEQAKSVLICEYPHTTPDFTYVCDDINPNSIYRYCHKLRMSSHYKFNDGKIRNGKMDEEYTQRCEDFAQEINKMMKTWLGRLVDADGNILKCNICGDEYIVIRSQFDERSTQYSLYCHKCKKILGKQDFQSK